MLSRFALASRWLDLVEMEQVPLLAPPASAKKELEPPKVRGASALDLASVVTLPAEVTAHQSGSADEVTILVVDDAISNIEILRETLRLQGHRILVATSGRDCLAMAVQNQPDLILLDWMMPEMDGLEVCRILKADPVLQAIPVIFCSALDDTDAKVEGLGAGAVDFITKPYEAAEVVARVNTQLAIRRLQHGLELRNAELERELVLAHELRRDALRSMQEAMIGVSDAVVRLRGTIETEARESHALLLLAEPGCGEEAVARAIHDASARQKRPFVAIECAQMGASDLSATSKALGLTDVLGHSKLDLAKGGTLFLCGVNHLTAELQTPLYELLLHLESACGPQCEAHGGLRIIASVTVNSTGGTLPAEFDKLLADRLSRHVLHLPTLADRRADIPMLVSLFSERHARRLGRVLDPPSESTFERLAAYSWPGNLRELEDVVRRSIGASRGPRIEVSQSMLGEGIPFGSYRLLRKLGQGGMGEVWEARHDLLARPAAVKLIRPEQLARANRETLRRRFEREARATANLRSQHTVTLYDFGVAEDASFYYVMELLNGIDLERVVEDFGPMPASRVVFLLEQACRSLAEAHSAGLVHRDIKPANLFLSKLGLEVDRLKVLDFGMVSCEPAPDETRVSMADEIYGTPECISPEAAVGLPSVDGRADVYGLGCVAYWMLTGKVVFEAASALGMLLRHIKDAPPPLSSRVSLEIPKPLEELVMSCLTKDRSRRPTALELLDGLTATGLSQTWTDREAREWWMAHLPDLMEK
jgi:DNA-binding NtrC family response regulator